MKMTIESTNKCVMMNGVDCRVWEGTTERGVAVVAFIPRVASAIGSDATEFERDLVETRVPSPEVAALPARMLL